MDKKEVLKLILQKLQPDRSLAEGILALIDAGYGDEKMIDAVLVLLQKAIRSIKDGREKFKFQRGLEKIQQIKSKEANEKIQDDELEKLLSGI